MKGTVTGGCGVKKYERHLSMVPKAVSEGEREGKITAANVISMGGRMKPMKQAWHGHGGSMC